MFDQKSLIVPDGADMWVSGRVIPQPDTGRSPMVDGPVTPDYVISLVPEIWVEALAKSIVEQVQALFATPGPIPYFPGAAGNLPVTQAQPLPVSQGVAALPPRQAGPPFGLILQMDVVPEYVVKTFQLVERDSGVGYKSDLYSVFIEGEALDTSLRRWLIVYTNHEYHAKRASELDRQLRDLIVDGVVVSLPVVG